MNCINLPNIKICCIEVENLVWLWNLCFHFLMMILYWGATIWEKLAVSIIWKKWLTCLVHIFIILDHEAVENSCGVFISSLHQSERKNFRMNMRIRFSVNHFTPKMELLISLKCPIWDSVLKNENTTMNFLRLWMICRFVGVVSCGDWWADLLIAWPSHHTDRGGAPM